MRGLEFFIKDVRQSKGTDEELKIINKELAKIRSKFKGSKPLDGYQKRKYICKLVFMFLLGYKYDFGLKEAVNLLFSNAYCDKQAGYLFISVVEKDECDLISLIISAIKNDLSSSGADFQNLALQFIANNSSLKLADSVAHPVMKLLSSSDTNDYVKQSAILALLQLLRVKSDLNVPDTTICFISNLICHHNLGLATASASLIEFLVKKSPFQYECFMTQCVIRLSKIVSSSCVELLDYSYYFVKAPWISVKLLRILQNFPPPSDSSLKATLADALKMILRTADDLPRTRKIFEHNNAKYAVIFEAISLIAHMEFEECILTQAFSILGTTLERKSINLRFMSLEMMVQLSSSRMYVEQAKMQMSAVLNILKSESDVTMKKRAGDFLYTICCVDNVKRIVDTMFNLLESESDFSENVMLKIAVLAEQFCNDREWYIDTLFNLLQLYGDKISDTIWHSVIKIVIENNSIQLYAAKASYAVLCEQDCREVVIKLAGYILGEFGYLIASDPRSSYELQFNVLKGKYHKCSSSTKALLLTSFLKLLNIYPGVKDKVQVMLKDEYTIKNEDIEIQQRAVEYLKLSEIASDTLLAIILEEMPSNERKISAAVAAIENENNLNFPVRQVENRSKRNNLKVFRSHGNLKTVVEDINKIRMTKSVSHSNLTHAACSNSLNLLVDIFEDTTLDEKVSDPLPRMLIPAFQTSNISNNQSFLHTLLFNEKATLYENHLIAITIECEFSKHCGRFHLKYINKTANEFSNFSIQKNSLNIQNKCSMWFKTCNSKLPANDIMEQDIHLECLTEFSERPSLKLTFVVENQYNEVKLILPLTLNKFVEPSHMTLDTFAERWQKFKSFNNQEVVKEFTAKCCMVYEEIREKLEGFRVGVIDNVNSDTENLQCAGIFYTLEKRVGFLLRLEMHLLDNKYCSRVMSSQPSLSYVISNLLSELF